MLASVEQALDLVSTNAVLGTYTPRQIVDWAAGEFGDGLVMSSSFGAESASLLHMATRAKPDIKVDSNSLSTVADKCSGFNDPAKGQTAAAGMYYAGADIVYQAAGGRASITLRG